MLNLPFTCIISYDLLLQAKCLQDKLALKDGYQHLSLAIWKLKIVQSSVSKLKAQACRQGSRLRTGAKIYQFLLLASSDFKSNRNCLKELLQSATKAKACDDMSKELVVHVCLRLQAISQNQSQRKQADISDKLARLMSWCEIFISNGQSLSLHSWRITRMPP